MEEVKCGTLDFTTNTSHSEWISVAEEACINIYLSLHVSQLGQVSEQIKKSWEAGQKLYHDRKPEPPKEDV